MTLETAKPVSASKSKKIAIVDDVLGHSKNYRKENCLFVRYRNCKPPSRDEIRLLHPNIIDVRFPRQKSAKYDMLILFCVFKSAYTLILDFAT